MLFFIYIPVYYIKPKIYSSSIFSFFHLKNIHSASYVVFKDLQVTIVNLKFSIIHSVLYKKYLTLLSSIR